MKTKDMLDTHDKLDHKIYFMHVERNQGDNWHSEQGGHNTHLGLVEEILLKKVMLWSTYPDMNQADTVYSQQVGLRIHCEYSLDKKQGYQKGMEQGWDKYNTDKNRTGMTTRTKIDGTDREWDQTRMTQEQDGKNKEQGINNDQTG
jgi:hypothetical protein